MYAHSALIGILGDYGYIKNPAPAHHWPYQLSSFTWFVSRLRAHCKIEKCQRSRSHGINFSTELALLLGKTRQEVLHLCGTLVSTLHSLLNQVPLPPAVLQSCRGPVLQGAPSEPLGHSAPWNEPRHRRCKRKLFVMGTKTSFIPHKPYNASDRML